MMVCSVLKWLNSLAIMKRCKKKIQKNFHFIHSAYARAFRCVCVCVCDRLRWLLLTSAYRLTNRMWHINKIIHIYLYDVWKQFCCTPAGMHRHASISIHSIIILIYFHTIRLPCIFDPCDNVSVWFSFIS